MKVIMAIAEDIFAIVLGVFILLWVLVCMFAEFPGLARYIRISEMS